MKFYQWIYNSAMNNLLRKFSFQIWNDLQTHLAETKPLYIFLVVKPLTFSIRQFSNKQFQQTINISHNNMFYCSSFRKFIAIKICSAHYS